MAGQAYASVQYHQDTLPLRLNDQLAGWKAVQLDSLAGIVVWENPQRRRITTTDDGEESCLRSFRIKISSSSQYFLIRFSALCVIRQSRRSRKFSGNQQHCSGFAVKKFYGRFRSR